MKDWKVHLLNAAIAGGLVALGSITPVLTGDADLKSVCLGIALGVVTGLIVFLNKMQEWVTSQDPDRKPKLFEFL